MFQFEMYVKVREHARERFIKAATKMANQYNAKKAAKFKKGVLVGIRIPKIDHTSRYTKAFMPGGQGAWKRTGVISSKVHFSESNVCT